MRQNKKLILLIVLGILAVLSLLYGISTPSKLRRDLSSAARLPAKESPKSSPSLMPRERLFRRSHYPLWGRNPFLAKEAPASPSGKLILNGIAWDQKNPRAVINNRIVTIGDKVGNSTVVEILRDHVVLNDGTANFEFRLGRRK